MGPTLYDAANIVPFPAPRPAHTFLPAGPTAPFLARAHPSAATQLDNPWARSTWGNHSVYCFRVGR